MADAKHYKIKVCLVGEERVGKTSLIHRFVSGVFDESYIRTVGAVVSKKRVALVSMAGRAVQVDMMILDIIGKPAFLQLFKEAYFQGAKGVFGVFDVTRRNTLVALRTWIEGVQEAVGRIPVFALGNKMDLRDLRATTEEDAKATLSPYGCPILYTSAKTGEHVEEAFHGLAAAIVAGDDGGLHSYLVDEIS